MQTLKAADAAERFQAQGRNRHSAIQAAARVYNVSFSAVNAVLRRREKVRAQSGRRFNFVEA